MEMPNIVIPDDYPVVMGSSPSFLKWGLKWRLQWRESTPVAYFDTLPGSEEGLLARIRDIRSSERLSDREILTHAGSISHEEPRRRRGSNTIASSHNSVRCLPQRSSISTTRSAR